MEKINAEINLSVMDYRRIMYFSVFKKNRLLSFFFLTAFLAGLFILFYFVCSKTADNLILLIAGIICFASPLIGCLLTEMKLNRFLSSERTATTDTNYITADEAGITSENQNTSLNRSWDMIYKIYETRKYFIIHLNSHQNIIFPKKSLESELKILDLKKLFIINVARNKLRFLDI